MRRLLLPIMTPAGLFLTLGAQAQTSPMTATCKDGSAFSGATRSGACRGYGGLQSWGAAPPMTSAPAAATPGTGAASKPAAADVSRGSSGAGQVWVNKKSKVYHCPGDRYYGKTKSGEYMPEDQAKSSGFHADHNKACAS